MLTNADLAAIEERAKAADELVGNYVSLLKYKEYLECEGYSDKAINAAGRACSAAKENLLSVFDADIPALVDAIRREREENQGLRTLLLQYGQHSDFCDDGDGEAPCTCGLAKELKQLRRDDEDKEPERDDSDDWQWSELHDTE